MKPKVSPKTTADNFITNEGITVFEIAKKEMREQEKNATRPTKKNK